MFEIQILSSEDETIGRAQIGVNEEEDITYSALVVLRLVPAQPENHKELIFGVVESGPDGERWHNDGQGTRGFLQGDDRSAVRACICAMALRVAQEAQPDVISMSTVQTYLPVKALSKYGYLCKALRDAGYYGGKGDSYHGSEIWMLERKKAET